MLINYTIGKKLLEALIKEIYSNKSIYAAECLLDALKNLGFHYATDSGLSISIEDLKTPLLKDLLLQEANKEIVRTSEKWEQGFITDAERFQAIIGTWTNLTENLKNKILAYYEEFDPLNSLYIMSSSGARGNTSQVGQLIGMRGLMADQKGQIIDLPIQSNFREGLTSTDYLVSSYGARKGIVDTALRTADAGYLTRTLIYLAQDLIIRVHDCKTKNGLSVAITCSEDFISIVGRVLISLTKKGKVTACYDTYLTPELIQALSLKIAFPFTLKVRSVLTCQAHGAACRVCYGWDLAELSPIALGEAVGIIAAQSIGEPGTQLTMRTFHTGGVFAGEKTDQISAPFSGWVEFPPSIQGLKFRTSHGKNVIETKENVLLHFLGWTSKTAQLEIPEGSILYLNQSNFVKKNQVIGQHKRPSTVNSKRRLMPIRTPFAGELFHAHTGKSTCLPQSLPKNQGEKHTIWIASGRICSLPAQAFYTFPRKLSKCKAFCILKIIAPFAGYLELDNLTIMLCSRGKKINLLLNALELNLTGCAFKISMLVKNHQYVDEQTVIALVYIFPKDEGKIYLCKKRSTFSGRKRGIQAINCEDELALATIKLFFITKADTWSICTDQITNINVALKNSFMRSGQFFHKNFKCGNSGFFLSNNGAKALFQNAYPIFLGEGARLSCKEGDFISKKQIIASQVRTTLRTEDIVQGIPKVFALIQGHKAKKASMWASQTGLFIDLGSLSPLRKKSCSNYMQKAKSFGHEKLQNMHRSNIPKKSHFEHVQYSISYYSRAIFHRWTSQKEIALKRPRLKSEKLNEEARLSTVLNMQLNPATISDAVTDIRFSIRKRKPKTTRFVESVFKPVIYYWPKTYRLIHKNHGFIVAGQAFVDGQIDPHGLLQLLCKNGSFGTPLAYPNFGFLEGDSECDKIVMGQREAFIYQLSVYPAQIKRALVKFRELLANSILGIYDSQGVTLSSKHLEIMVSQLTSKAIIKRKKYQLPINQVDFYDGEIVSLPLIEEIYNSCLESESENDRLCPPIYLPSYRSATNISSLKDGFLAPAAWQQTKKALTAAAIFGKRDWLRNVKENVIAGRKIPVGTTHFNWTNNMDAVYFFKNEGKYCQISPAESVFDDIDILEESEPEEQKNNL